MGHVLEEFASLRFDRQDLASELRVQHDHEGPLFDDRAYEIGATVRCEQGPLLPGVAAAFAEEGIDYGCGDLRRVARVSSFGACDVLCQGDPACLSWSWAAAVEHAQTCFLKSSLQVLLVLR